MGGKKGKNKGKLGGFSLDDQDKALRERSKEQQETAKNVGTGGVRPLSVITDKKSRRKKYTDIDLYEYKMKPENNIIIVPFITATDNCPINSISGVNSKVEKGIVSHYLPLFSHSGIGLNNQHKPICPASNLNIDSCPVCEDQSNYDFKSKEFSQLKAVCRPYYLIIDCENIDAGLQVMNQPYFNFERLLQKKLEKKRLKGKAITPWSLKQPYSISFDAEEKKFESGVYYEFSDFEFEKTELDISIIEKAPSLDSFMNIKTYDEIKELQGADFVKSDKDDNDENEKEIPGTDNPKFDGTDKNDSNPDCFGEQFEADDDDCDNCDVRKKCKKAMKKEEEPKKKAKGKSKSKTQCPVEDGTFGESIEDYDECSDCEFYDDCNTAYEENK
jgi:hypothetical protein